MALVKNSGGLTISIDVHIPHGDIPEGGTTDQVLAKVDGVNLNMYWKNDADTGGGGGVSDGDKGDVVVSSSGTVWTIDPAVLTTAGRALIDDVDATAQRATLGLTIGTHVQAFDADLTTWAGLTPSANAQSLVTSANYAAMRALLDLEAGTDFYSIAAANAAFQPLDADLTTWAGLTPSANAQSLVTAASYAAMRALLDLEAGTDFYSIAALDNTKIATITFIIDGGGATITTGVKGYLEIPFGCTITRATALADQSGSIVVDIWKDTFANYPPVDADSITSAAPVTISSAVASQDATLTGWNTAITAGDILGFNVDSITTCQRVTISLRVTKS